MRAGALVCEHVNPGPELSDLELRGGKCAIHRQADLGQAGRSPSGCGLFIVLRSCGQLVMSWSCGSGAMGTSCLRIWVWRWRAPSFMCGPRTARPGRWPGTAHRVMRAGRAAGGAGTGRRARQPGSPGATRPGLYAGSSMRSSSRAAGVGQSRCRAGTRAVAAAAVHQDWLAGRVRAGRGRGR